MSVQKLITILILIKSIKTEHYIDYVDYQNEQFYPNTIDDHDSAKYDNQIDHPTHHDHAKDHDLIDRVSDRLKSDLSEHTMVTDSNVFPFMASVLKGSKFLSNGALIDKNWVLTTADGLFLMRESIRLLRVRLGSINYKKGGVILPVKLLEIHPYFDDKSPNFDLALVMLARPVRYTPTLRAIRLQLVPRDVTSTHFIVTSWPGPLLKAENSSHLQSMEEIKRLRLLTVTHLHPADPEKCAEELKEIEAGGDAIMCLEPALRDPCLRDTGAPVVLNQILWAVISSWKSDDCDETSPGPVFATLVSANNVSTWVHAVVHGHRWKNISWKDATSNSLEIPIN